MYIPNCCFSPPIRDPVLVLTFTFSHPMESPRRDWDLSDGAVPAITGIDKSKPIHRYNFALSQPSVNSHEPPMRVRDFSGSLHL